MQTQDFYILHQFILSQTANFIVHCKEYGLSEFEADRIIDELEELANG
ncbi:hypothetical protein J3U21_06550 [Gilliamella sp. B2776]|nr:MULTISPECIES: hypothetical protein [unclassified Gilliamella]MCX8650036.1 hypothetical protein [Gilliamella sp. B2779]MCX8654969.1 hypothetical protein [Gilliamella sp. B2737]MCX8656449.1 hypothetical protein [Gilliamella sp. B2894]MCX8665679.1 hypothetical protein [Gilliamella sp. B2887]MCX8691809.1 hypothetical protein [Gilliamella sp. B2776]